MIVIDCGTVKGHLTPQPYQRYLSVLASPRLQPEVKGFSVGMTVISPGQKSSSHTHDRETETWVVLSGRGKVVLDGEAVPVKAQSLIVVTPGMEHQLVNDSDDTLKVLWVYTPDGPEQAVLENRHV